jgi:hypothetical protein
MQRVNMKSLASNGRERSTTVLYHNSVVNALSLAGHVPVKFRLTDLMRCLTSSRGGIDISVQANSKLLLLFFEVHGLLKIHATLHKILSECVAVLSVTENRAVVVKLGLKFRGRVEARFDQRAVL